MRLLNVALLTVLAAVQPAQAQISNDSSSVFKVVLSHYASAESSPSKIGVVGQTFTPNGRGGQRGMAWRPQRPADPAALASIHPKLRPVATRESTPTRCENRTDSRGSGTSKEFCGLFRDYDAVLSLSEPLFSGNTALVTVIVESNSTKDFERQSVNRAVYSYQVEMKNGQWTVVKVSLSRIS